MKRYLLKLKNIKAYNMAKDLKNDPIAFDQALKELDQLRKGMPC